MPGLTDSRLKTLKKEGKPVKVSDGEGLYIEVDPRGAMRWRLACRFGGKQRTLTFGPYPEVSLKAARLLRAEARLKLAAGLDPAGERKAGAQAVGVAADGAPTFREVAQEFAAKRAKEGTKGTTQEKLEWLLDLTYPTLGDRPIAQITAPEVLKVLQVAEAKGQYETAKRLRATMSRVFRFAVATVRAPGDPAAALTGALTNVPVVHRAAVTDPEKVGALMRAIKDYPGDPSTRAGLLLLAYTFLRPGEVRHLRWSDVDWKAARITVPADRMKLPRAHVVPMSRQVVELLEWMMKISGRGELILPGLRTPTRPISEVTMNAALRRLGFTKEEATPHGFRTTASTLLNEGGWNRDWIERQLAHVEGNAVRRAYDRAEHIEGRTQMMQAYADLLDDLAARKE